MTEILCTLTRNTGARHPPAAMRTDEDFWVFLTSLGSVSTRFCLAIGFRPARGRGEFPTSNITNWFVTKQGPGRFALGANERNHLLAAGNVS